MANWSNPLLTSTYTNFLAEVKDRDTDLALQFDGTTSSNIPTGAIRWNSSVNRWQKWSGSAWGELTSTYALTGLSTTGNASIGGTLGSGAITSTGSVSGTALIPTGNTVPATGVYLPSTNVFGVATSSTARIIVDANGYVGIGTLSPAMGLHVAVAAPSAASGNFYVTPGSQGQARMRLYNQGGQTEWIFGQKTGTDHDFKLSKSVAGSETDYITIDTSGRVGVGNGSPAFALDVVNPSFGVSFATSSNWNYSGLILRRNASNASTAKMLSMMLQGDTDSDTTLTNYLNIWGTYSSAPTTGSTTAGLNGVMNLGAPNALAFHTNASERARIDSSGNLGLGTTAPYSRFTVVPSSTPSTPATANQITVGESTANSGYRLQLGYLYDTLGRGSIQAYDNNNPSPLILNGAGGYVGIGTATPATILQVSGNPPSAESGNIYIANSGQARYRLFNGGGQAEWLFGQKTSTDHAFKLSKMVAGAESDYLTVTTTGLVGLGTTSPETVAEVFNAATSGHLTLSANDANGSDQTGIDLDWKVKNQGHVVGRIRSIYDSSLSGGTGGFKFLTRNAGTLGEVMRLTGSGRVGIGTSSPAYALDVVSADTTAGVGYALRLRANATAGAAALQFTDNGATSQYGYIGCDSSSNLKFTTGVNERFRIASSGFLGHNTTNPAAPVHFALPTTSATIGNVYVAPSTPGQARFHLYNGGSQAEWLFGQRTSTDHEFRFSTQVAGSETERLRIGIAGQIGIGGANYGTSGQVLTSNGSGSAPSWNTVTALTAGTAVSATGTAVDFTGIPSSAKRITVMIDGVSMDSLAILAVQLGDSGGIETSGYTGGLAWTGPSTGSSGSASTFPLAIGAESDTVSGHAVITKVSGNTWVLSSTMARDSDDIVFISGGSKVLSATLDRIRITTTSGSASFDAGTVNILHE